MAIKSWAKLKDQNDRGKAQYIGAKHKIKRKRKGSERFIIAKNLCFMAFAKISHRAKMSRHGSVFANKGKMTENIKCELKMEANSECKSQTYK